MTPPPSDEGGPAGADAGGAAEVVMRGITKSFPGVRANDDVDLTVARGEIHALMGENGAGKSTLMSILYGMQRPDAGTISVGGREVAFSSPTQAIAAGLGMVHQGFKLFPSLTVTENVVYGREPRRRGLVDRSAARREVAALTERFGLGVDPDAVVGTLPVGVRQRVEILKLLYREARVLILDEPTAVLTPAETDALFDVLRDLAAAGRTILIVTHKLREVMALSDNVTVLRDGRVTARLRTADTTPAEIAEAMTGRAVELDRRYPAGAPGEPILTADRLTVLGDAGKPLVDAISCTVRAGEIVGIAGVAGNGQTELIEAMVGLRRSDAGRVTLDGRDITAAPVAERRAAGLAYVPEDRAEVGSAAGASVTDNLALGFHRAAPLTVRGLLRPGALREHARRLIAEFGVKGNPADPVRTLSGGNHQKVILGREMAHDARLLIVEQPTRGVDIGAIENIHARLVGYRDAGHAILLVSAELSEIIGLSDRILVMSEGRVVADLDRDEADETRLGLAMAGAAEEVA